LTEKTQETLFRDYLPG